MGGTQVRVQVGGEQYALPVEYVHEVVDLGEVTPVPGAPDSVLGLRNLSGEIVPAFDLARVLEIERDGRPRHLLVTECNGQRVAFALDDVINVGPLAGTMQELESQHLLASTVLDGVLVGLLDVDALFDLIAPESER